MSKLNSYDGEGCDEIIVAAVFRSYSTSLSLGPDEGGSGSIADEIESPDMSKFNSCVVKVFLSEECKEITVVVES